MHAVGKWIPAKTRESAFSCAACEKLANERVIPGNGGPLVVVNGTWSCPKNRPRPSPPAPRGAVSRWVVGDGRCHQKRCPGWISHCVSVPVRFPGSYSRDRAPEVIEELRVSVGDVGIGQCKINQSKESGIFPKVEIMPGRDNPGDAIPSLRRRLVPECGDLALLGSP